MVYFGNPLYVQVRTEGRTSCRYFPVMMQFAHQPIENTKIKSSGKNLSGGLVLKL